MDKPAHRLARLGESRVAAALLLAAASATCEAPGRTSGIQGTVASLVVTPTIVTLSPGQMQDFTAVGFTATGDTALIAVSWTATGGTVDTSSSGRRHYAHYHNASCGAFRLVATSNPGALSDSAAITVSCPATVASVVVTPASATLTVGQTALLTATPEDSIGNPLSGRTVTWSSGDTTIAKVNGSGLVSGIAMGSTSITAASEGKSGAATLTVTNVPVASVAVTPATASITVGQTTQLTATPKDASGNPLTGRVVTWSTSDTTIAPVTASGLVTGRAAGTATITATSEGKSGTATITVTASRGGTSFDHVFIVMEENNDYLSVTSTSMPYLTGLAAQGGLATQYYADTHPSIGNYLMLSSGQIITNNDNYASTINVDNVVRELVAAGKTWKSYAEGLPSVGFVTLNYDDNTYASRHNPVVYYTDVHDDTTQAKNVVPFTQFATDLASGSLPNYTFIVPNLCNDAHDCPLTTADSWLQTNIDPLVKSTFFQQHNCLLIITFDESASDNTNGGGRVYWLALGSKVKAGYQSTTLYQHESMLRLMLKGLGVTTLPGAAASAPDMSEFYTP